ncbi:MAG: hypothetical protein QOD33_68 [Pyrinomonadaceae bacterium]|jgi:hypothetical protein|nr:hypothetical protein [Pyrinomonadaceae bacterium]
MLKTIISVSAIVLFSFGCSKNSGSPAASTAAPAPGGATQASQNVAGELRSKVPDGWTSEKPTSDMRVAQYKLPRADGDTEDALLVVYYFGKGQGGSAQANIDRWINQVKQPDGQPSKDKAKTDSLTVNGLAINTVDVSGNYGGGMSPDSAPTNSSAIYRLRAAVVDTPKGSYFVKLTGPENTIKHWDQAYNDYLHSFEFK